MPLWQRRACVPGCMNKHVAIRLREVVIPVDVAFVIQAFPASSSRLDHVASKGAFQPEWSSESMKWKALSPVTELGERRLASPKPSSPLSIGPGHAWLHGHWQWRAAAEGWGRGACDSIWEPWGAGEWGRQGVSLGWEEPRGFPELLLPPLTVGWLDAEPSVCVWELAGQPVVLELEIGFLQQKGGLCLWLESGDIILHKACEIAAASCPYQGILANTMASLIRAPNRARTLPPHCS